MNKNIFLVSASLLLGGNASFAMEDQQDNGALSPPSKKEVVLEQVENIREDAKELYEKVKPPVMEVVSTTKKEMKDAYAEVKPQVGQVVKNTKGQIKKIKFW